MAVSVQFNSLEMVLKAYENRGADFWALYQGKQFLFKGTGLDELQTILNYISEGGTNAVYTLRIYESLNDVSEIKNNTDFDGSFNFKLNEATQIMPQAQMSSYNKIIDRINELEERITETSEVQENELPENSIIGQILGNPAISALIPVLVERLIKFLDGNKPTMIEQAKKPESYQAVLNGVPEGGVLQTVERLKKYDANIDKHLEKLLTLAEKNNAVFNMLISQLENLEL